MARNVGAKVALPPRVIDTLSAAENIVPGADADITLYRPSPDLARMFSMPAKVFKAGVLVAEDGEMKSGPRGRTLSV